MKYWNTGNGFISLKAKKESCNKGKIINIYNDKDFIEFVSYGYYTILTKEEAIKALQEAIQYIKGE